MYLFIICGGATEIRTLVSGMKVQFPNRLEDKSNFHHLPLVGFAQLSSEYYCKDGGYFYPLEVSCLEGQILLLALLYQTFNTVI